MATDALRHGSRAAKQQSEQAAKDRRAKIMLAVGGVLLLIVLVFEIPKTMSNLHKVSGSQPVTTTPAVTTPSVGTPAAGAHATNLKAVDKFAAKDPFVVQVGPPEAAVAPEVAATPPAVRSSHFVAKDPFVQQLSPTAAGAGVAPSVTAKPAAKGGAYGGSSTASKASKVGGYIVMVASVPVASGRAAAESEAVRARGRGVSDVKIVGSSSYPTLREGFFAVYSGPYPTLSAALVALGKVRGHGYPSAYTRRLAH